MKSNGVLKPSTNGKAVNRIAAVKAVAPGGTEGKAVIKPLIYSTVSLGIIGRSPLIMHAWSVKALREMREKHAGKKTKNRDVRDPQREAEEATYKTRDGKPGIPAMAIKNAIIEAAHKDLGVEKTLVRKALFLKCGDPKVVIQLEYESVEECVEDLVRVAGGSPDLRYRPYFYGWKCRLEFVLETNLLTVETFVTLVNRAGMSVGVCEQRPERGGEYGRFEVDPDVKIRVS
jgi:hypothetical protein